MTAKPNDVIQVTDPADVWYCLLLIVEAVDNVNATAYMLIPMWDNGAWRIMQEIGNIKHGSYAVIGHVRIVPA